ncbi:MAG: 2-dehydropantoate 2-reductase [Alphaproteobacteria bacterium]|nr:2-dehydropantoate 2-reductase [Alphaproteobacteria bacterium]
MSQRILVLGAGAIGGYYGGRLVEIGGDVTFLVRPRRAEQIARDGLRIVSSFGDWTGQVKTVTAGQSAGDFDLILLTCKAYDLEAAIRDLAPFAAGARVLPVLNGIRHLDALDAVYGRKRVMAGTCHIGATLDADGTVRHMNQLHNLLLGPRDPDQAEAIAALAALCGRAKMAIKTVPEPMVDLWAKVVFLAPLAAMCCLMRGTVGDIVATPDGTGLMRRALAECAAIAGAAGFPPSDKHLALTGEGLTRAGSPQHASMLRDLRKGGATEAEHILGDLVGRAQAAGIDAPLLTAALAHLRVYEAGRDPKKD